MSTTLVFDAPFVIPRAPRARTVDLTVAIVSYRSAALLERCLATWRAGTRGIRAELRVVENGTGERLEALLARHVPEARLVVEARSIGFGAAVNRALAGAAGRHVALLNPDTLLGAGSLSRLVDRLDARPDVGVVGPRVWDDPDRTSLQRSWRAFPGCATALFHRHSVLTRLWPSNRWSRAYLRLDRPPALVQETDWVSGCCMVVRGELFRRLGGLDAGFPMFCEDVDLCRRAKALGYRVLYDPRAEIVHLVGGSRRTAPLRSEWLRHRSMGRYVLKYRPRKSPLTWALVAGVWSRFALTALLSGARR